MTDWEINGDHAVALTDLEQDHTVRFIVEDQEVLMLDKDGMKYGGKRIEDAGEAHRAFLRIMRMMFDQQLKVPELQAVCNSMCEHLLTQYPKLNDLPPDVMLRIPDLVAQACETVITQRLEKELNTMNQAVADWRQKVKEARIEGLKDGLRRYAWWKDGTQYVGTCGTTLKKALEDVDKEEG